MNIKELLEASGAGDAIRFLKRSLGQGDKCPCCGGSSSKSSGDSGGSSHVSPGSSSSPEPCEAILNIAATVVYFDESGTSSIVASLSPIEVRLPASRAIDVDFPDFEFNCINGCCVEVRNFNNWWEAWKSDHGYLPDYEPHEHAESSFNITFKSGTTDMVGYSPCYFVTKGFKMHITPTSIVCDEYIRLELRIEYRCVNCEKSVEFYSGAYLWLRNCWRRVSLGSCEKPFIPIWSPLPINHACEEYGISLSSDFDKFYVEDVRKGAYGSYGYVGDFNIEVSGIEQGQILTTPEIPIQYFKLSLDDPSKDPCCANIVAYTSIDISVMYHIVVHITWTKVDCDGNQEIRRIERSYDVSSLEVESSFCDLSSGSVYLDLDLPPTPAYHICSDPAVYDVATGTYRVDIGDLRVPNHDVYLEYRCIEDKCDCFADLNVQITFVSLSGFTYGQMDMTVGRDGGWDFMPSFGLGVDCSYAAISGVDIEHSTCPGEIEIEQGGIERGGGGGWFTSPDWKIYVGPYQRRCHDEHISCTVSVHVYVRCSDTPIV